MLNLNIINLNAKPAFGDVRITSTDKKGSRDIVANSLVKVATEKPAGFYKLFSTTPPFILKNTTPRTEGKSQKTDYILRSAAEPGSTKATTAEQTLVDVAKSYDLPAEIIPPAFKPKG